MTIQLSDHFTYKKLLRFCFPPIVMMMFTSIYGVVDGLFVSNFVGKIPFAAINLVMPFVMILGGFGFMIGTGGSALVAKTLGENDKERANRYFTMMIQLTLCLGVVLSVVGVLFIRPISYLLGATDSMIEDCVLYGRVVLSFNTAFMLQNVFQTFLAAAEKPKLGLAATVAAGVTNMALDALFIVGFGWGVAGAALATGLSQCIGGILPLLYFLRPNSSLLRLTKTRPEGTVLLKACANGSSEMVTNIAMSLVGILYNWQLLRFIGEDGVAAYGVIMYTVMIFSAVFMGYAIGTSPLMSFQYGAQNHTEMRSLLWKSLGIIGVASVVMFLLGQWLAAPLSAIFVSYDAALLELTVSAYKLYALCFLFMGFAMYASAFFTALNNGLVSALISFLRTLVFPVAADLIARAGKYKSKALLLVSYVVFSYGLTGPILPLWFMKDAYVASLQARGKDAAYIDGVFVNINTGTFFISMIAILVCAVLGGWFGQRMMKKHFIKAGIA